MQRLLLMSILLLSVVMAQNVDFDTEIQPIFDTNCISCHGTNAGLSLASGSSLNNLVDVVSQNYAPDFRVLSGDPTNSVLYNKVAGTDNNGQQMPQGGNLTTEQISLIANWITELDLVTIAEARADTLGATVVIEGIITSPNFGSTWTQHTVQDPTGGLVVYAGFLADIEVGDAVTIRGELVNYNGVLEITPVDPALDIIIWSKGNDLPATQVLTIAELLADPENYESELISIDSVETVSGSWPSSGSSSNLTISDPSSVTMTMRIDSDTDIDENPAMLGYYKLLGVVGQYDGSDPYDSGYQIFPRFYSDFIPIGDPTPQFSVITRDPSGPTPTDDVTVSATIVDNGTVASASINYVVDSGTTIVVAMTAGANDIFTGVIPAQVGNALVIYTISATDNFGGISTSDEFSYIVYDGIVTSIASIQDGTVAVDSLVTVQGIVTAEPYAFYPEDDLRYYFIQDASAALSGIKVYDAGRIVVEGDEVRLTGKVTEYYDMTEIIDVDALEILSSGNVMDPVTVLLSEGMEQYEGCLITVVNVTVSNPDLGYGEWSISDGTNTIGLDDAADYFYTPIQDEALASVVGVLDYSFGAYKIQPRLAQDIQTADGLTRIQAIQQVRYSDLMPHYTALDSSLYFADTSYYYEGWTDTSIVIVQGIVTMPTGLSYAGNGVKFILQDVNGGAWSSILSYHPDSSAFPVLFEGDLVKLTGSIMEFTTPGDDGASSMTELFISQDPVILDIGLPVPEEPVINTGDLRWPTTAEQWGNVTVKVQNATIITNNPTGFDILAIDDGSGVVYIDDDSDSLSNYIQPPAGSTFDEVRGWVYHHYGSYDDSTTYKLVPFYESDLLLNTTAINNMQAPEGFTLRNYPNPFNPVTNIAFRIPEAQPVQLVIYNQLGQHVVTLMDQTMSAGEYEVAWRGFDAKGKPVSSGLYFYRLVAGSEQLVGKMTYLK